MIYVYSATGNIIGLLASSSHLPCPKFLSQYHIDQLLIYHPDTFEITIYNQDGSTAYQCGNGLRALGYHLKKNIKVSINKKEFSINYQDDIATANIGFPSSIESVLINKEKGSKVIIGNNHLVFQSPPNALIIEKHHQEFNISFIKRAKDVFTIQTYERGAGWTKSCGSAASASAFILFQETQTTQWRALTDGGNLSINIQPDGCYISGGITFVQSVLV